VVSHNEKREQEVATRNKITTAKRAREEELECKRL